MKFETSKKIDKWVEKHREKCVSHATAGEQFIYKFLPSGIIECQTVESKPESTCSIFFFSSCISVL